MKKYHYKFILAYDGTRYNGWQNQKNTHNTIQEKLEVLLSRMTNEEIEVRASGRTDAGVHALGQVGDFYTNCNMTENQILIYMNEYLPEDISILSVTQASDRFHSRLNAKEKIYEYRILNSVVPDVFERKYQYQVSQKLDLEKMKQAAKFLNGTHDFKGFCSTKKGKKSTVRSLYSIAVSQKGNQIHIFFRGNGFLYNMVRIMTGTLIETGLGKREPESVLDVLENGDRTKAGFKAPAKGLFLASVRYELEE